MGIIEVHFPLYGALVRKGEVGVLSRRLHMFARLLARVSSIGLRYGRSMMWKTRAETASMLVLSRYCSA